MNIAFDPPIGETLHVGLSPLRPTVLLFTARLSVHDYERIVNDGGRVQLWSDVVLEGRLGGGWHEVDFVESAQHAKSPDNAHIISLRGTLTSSRLGSKDKVLYLVLRLPPEERIDVGRFQFTYRISYPSRLEWLGGFRENGAILLDAKPPDDLLLHDGWSSDVSGYSSTFQAHQIDGLEVAGVQRFEEFRVVALGEDGFLPALQNASLVFILPLNQPRVILRPTYILVASPGLSMSIDPSGVLTLSGSGTTLLHTHEMRSDPRLFIQGLLDHSGLNAWNILASDASFHSVILASISTRSPVHAVAIPLCPSEHLLRPLLLPLANYFDANDSADRLQRLALFSSNEQKLHICHREFIQHHDVAIKFDAVDTDFVLSPVHQLQSDISSNIRGTWAVTILSPYNLIPTPSPLPTPPPSPSLHPIRHLSQSSMDTAVSSVETLPPDTGISLSTKVGEDNSYSSKSTSPSSSPRVADSTTSRQSWTFSRRSTSPPHPHHLRSLLAMLIRVCFLPGILILKFFLRVFWFRIFPFPLWLARLRGPTVEEQMLPQERMEETRAKDGNGNGRRQGNGNGQQEQTGGDRKASQPPSQAPENKIPKPVMPSATSNDRPLFVELHGDRSKGTNVSTIALFLLDGSEASVDGIKADEVVKVLDSSGSSFGLPPSECSVRRCDIDVVGQAGKGFCYLLELQMECEEGGDMHKGSVISIRAPSS